MNVILRLLKIMLVAYAAHLMTSCNKPINKNKKTAILKADREASLGWVYLTIYQDSTFEFVLTGIRSDKDVYTGKVEIRKDSMIFSYADSIPGAGKKAVFDDKTVSYIGGEYPEQLNISLTRLKK